MRCRTYIGWAIAYFVLVLAVPVAAEQFEGIVDQLNPLQVRSLQGEVLQFSPLEQDKTAQPKEGDFIRITYKAGPKVNTFSEINIIGGTIKGKVKEIAADKSWIVVSLPGKMPWSLQTSKEFQPTVTAMQPGDGIRAIYFQDKGVYSIRALEWQYEVMGRGECWGLLFLAAGILFLVAFVFTKGHPTRLYLGADNRYSNSKFQTVLWFWMVISAYVAIVIIRIIASGWSYIGGVNIPQNLLILSGISVLTFAAAKAITVGKVEQSEQAKPSADVAKPSNLVSDDLDRTDLGDFQMVVVSFLAVIIYAISTVEFMRHLEFRSMITMPDVDATLLAIFGLSQAAYLGKKVSGGGDAGSGITPDQAIKAAADAANATKEAAAKATAASESAKQKKDEAIKAAGDAIAAGQKAAAQTELDKAQSAVQAARDKANEAAQAAKLAEARAADVKKLAINWAKEPATAAPTKSSSDLAQREADAAKTAAVDADTAAKSAEQEANKAKLEVDKKP